MLLLNVIMESTAIDSKRKRVNEAGFQCLTITWQRSRSLLQDSAASPQASVVQQRLTLVLAIMTAMEGEEASDALISDAIRIASTVRARVLPLPPCRVLLQGPRSDP